MNKFFADLLPMLGLLGLVGGLLLAYIVMMGLLNFIRSRFDRPHFRGEIEYNDSSPVAPSSPATSDGLQWEEMEPEEDPRPARFRPWSPR